MSGNPNLGRTSTVQASSLPSWLFYKGSMAQLKYYSLSEQRLRIESLFKEIDAVEDIEILRSIAKEIATSREAQKTAVCQAIQEIRCEIETQFQRSGKNYQALVL